MPTPPVDVQNFWPEAGPTRSLSLRSSDIEPHWGTSFALMANWMRRPLYLEECLTGTPPNCGTTRSHDVVAWAITTDFSWSLSLFNRVRLGLTVPLVVAQAGEGLAVLMAPAQATNAQLSQTALRDIRFHAGVQLFGRARVSTASGPGLRIDVGAAIPTGDERSLQGAGGWTFAPMIVADYRVHGFTTTVNVGLRLRDTVAIGDTLWGSQLDSAVGVAYQPSGFDRLLLGVDYAVLVPIHGVVTVANGPVSALGVTLLPMELRFGARVAVDRGRDVEFVLGGGVPTSGAATNPNPRVFIGFAYAPRGLDDDADGVIDSEDECLGAREDRDGFQDGDGCPDTDNDQDGVLDAADRCPDVAEDADNVDDGDGCPDPDNDHDGILDADDACATTPAGDRPDPERAGCPVPDRDGDGVLDGDDRCPDQVPGPLPDPVRRGCALPDRDHDGVEDDRDACVSDPAGEHPDAFRAGCPDTDRDHDGVANEVDRCADEPETVNGVTDDDGCPDAGAETVTMAGPAVIFQPPMRLRTGARALAPAERSRLAQAAQRLRGRGAAVASVRVTVVGRPGAAADPEAMRLATLVADALGAGGIARATVTAAFVADAAGGRSLGEVRIVAQIVTGATSSAGRAQTASAAPRAASSTPPTATSSSSAAP